jgi:hypothetical protein
MKRIFASEDRTLIAHIIALLEARTIPYVVKNQGLAGAIGGIPPLECQPEIWIMDEANYTPAMEIVAAVTGGSAAQVRTGAWKCQCGEAIEAQFSACWQCGRPAPESMEQLSGSGVTGTDPADSR